MRHDETRFSVRYSRTSSGAFRVAMNGRLRPPTIADRPGDRSAAPGFVAVAVSATAGDAGGFVDIDIEADRTGASVSVVGADVALDGLSDHLRRALALIEGVCQRSIASDEAVACCAHHATWLGRLAFHRGEHEVADGRLADARTWFTSALLYDGDLLAAREALRRVETRMARPNHEIEHLAALAMTAGTRQAASARRDLRDALRARAEGDRSQQCRRRAIELTAAGDLESARRWAEQARVGDDDGSVLRRTQAEIERRRGRPYAAFEFGLEQLEQHGFEPALVLAMHDDCVSMGDPQAALQLLALHWHHLLRSHHDDAVDRLRRTVLLTGSGIAARIFMAAGIESAGSDLLARWTCSGTADAAGLAALTRLTELRATLALPIELRALPLPAARSIQPGFELAPGVTPAR